MNISEMFEPDATVITGHLIWEPQDEFIHAPLYLLDPALTDEAREQTWFHLGGDSYVIQIGAPRQEEQGLVIQVVGIADMDGLTSNVLLLG